MGRIGYIDGLKGITILFVIIGHLIQYAFYPETFDDNILFRYIYSFHMPFFMVLSGFTVNVNISSREELISKISKRFINLIIPFISWAIIKYYIFDGPTVLEVFANPMNGLWFLYALFFIYTIFLITTYLTKKMSILKQSLSILGISLLLKFISLRIHDYGIGTIATHFIYFYLGYVLFLFKDKLITKDFTRFLWFSIPLFFLLAFFWHRNSGQNNIFDTPILNSIISSVPYRFIIVIIATYSLFLIFYRQEKLFKRIGLEYIGKITLGIYATHQLFIRVLLNFSNNIINYFHNQLTGQITFFFLILCLSVLSVKVIHFFRFSSFLLLGKPFKLKRQTK